MVEMAYRLVRSVVLHLLKLGHHIKGNGML
jgi:hypothetical protein